MNSTPSEATTLGWTDIQRDYRGRISETDWHLIRNRRTVRGVPPPPSYRSAGRRAVCQVLRTEIEAYLERVATWRATFLRSDGVSRLLGLPSFGREINDNWVWKRGYVSGQFRQIRVPAAYRFTDMPRRPYWHAKDVALLARYLVALGQGRIETSLAWGWEAEADLWHPAYPMPTDPLWAPGMTEATRLQAAEAHRFIRQRQHRRLPVLPPPGGPEPGAPAFAGG